MKDWEPDQLRKAVDRYIVKTSFDTNMKERDIAFIWDKQHPMDGLKKMTRSSSVSLKNQ